MVTTDVFARVSAIGPYFAVSHGPRPDASRYRPLSELYGDHEVLDRYVEAVARRLGTGQRRVAASTLHIGTAARLWSIGLATASLTGRVPDLAPGRLWWRTPESGPIDLWLPEATTTAAAPDGLADGLHEAVVVRNLLPLADAVRRHYGVSPHALRGNAASALIGAVRVLLAHAPGAPHPPVPLATALLEREPLAGAGAFTAQPLTYRRRSCCLYYRVRGAGYCGDCVLTSKGPRA
ncbi:(2Fe-2S)-binding protein [Streptomyces ficellus]|uniref:Ferric iron reductase n=1 Tax=Streptomyces ficellus TaxID=1977088 RepID=A0A6I6FAN6_9ACTN|nr:(2Fe-2S)-binding protein [Streptomyces ficellus]QGV77242.1 ferric iron reductase [Streptomyces ficellus]